MYYVCIENNQVTGIQSYEPAVPSSVSVVTITDQQHQQIIDQTHRFDVPSKTVLAVDSAILAEKEQYRLNGLGKRIFKQHRLENSKAYASKNT